MILFSPPSAGIKILLFPPRLLCYNGAGGVRMIEQFVRRFALPCRGGFIAYYNDMNVYAPDPMWMLSRSVVILICSGGRMMISHADLTLEDRAAESAVFCAIERDVFAKRSTGALFAQGRYFSIREGEFAGSYQISDDLIQNERFPNPRAYRRFLFDAGQTV